MNSEFPETRQSLIARVQNRVDATAWDEFLAIYQPVVLRMAQRRGLQEADALDVKQQVFLSISNSIERWTPDPDKPPFRAWLTVVARNAITKHLARQPRDRASGSTTVAKLLESQPDQDNISLELCAETRHELFRWAAQQIRDEFSEVTWSVFWQTAVEGETAATVAKRSGRSVGAIYVARYRVMTRLKEKVIEASRQWDL